MILIQDKIVSMELIREEFVCHLEKCKGVCCIGGDYGAPIEADEIPFLKAEFEKIRPFMEESGIAAVEEHGVWQEFAENRFAGVTLRADQACAFVRVDPEGIAHCAIETAWQAGATRFRKPISCHLYPVRVKRSEAGDFEALNYDRWSLCSPACRYGKKLGVPVYRFVREALVRKYGQEFYDELDEVATDLAGQ